MEEQGPPGRTRKRAYTEDLLEEVLYVSRSKKRRVDFDSHLDYLFDQEGENVPRQADDAIAGQIRRIYVENFMCHRKLTIDFNKHLTFVGGVKDSGKSAIAAALVMCLGAATLSDAQRIANPSVIREGSNGPAIVKVFLSNEGSDAYRPLVYGKTIVLMRKIFDHFEGYELLNSKEELVTKDEREVENILRAFNIHVDNPCCVLTQEESKKFLQGSDHDKYKLFLKACGLDKFKDELDAIKKSIDDFADQMKSTAEFLKIYKEMDAILKQLTVSNQTVDDIKLSRVRSNWEDHKVAKATVEAKKKIVNEKRVELTEARKALEAFNPLINEKAQLTILTNKISTKLDEIVKDEILLTVSTNFGQYTRKKLTEAETDRNKQIQRQTEIKHWREILLAVLDNNRNELEASEGEMQTTNGFDTKDTENELAELQRTLDKINRYSAATETKIQTINLELEEYQTEKRDAERGLDERRPELNELQTEMERLKETKRHRTILIRKVTNKQRLFDKESSALKEATLLMQEKLSIAWTRTMELIEGEEVASEGVNENQEVPLQLGNSMERVIALHNELQNDLAVLNTEYEELQRNPVHRTIYDDQYDRFQRSLKSCARKVTYKFGEYNRKKRFPYTVCFNHGEGTLSLTVMTDSSVTNTTSKDVKHLSGWERSYVTFGLLLALGHVIECPFRLMDEYDVSLDEYARKVTLDQLVECSKMSDQKQLLVFTRHKLNELITGKDVQIVKMKDPKRLSVHGLQQQSLIN